MNKRNERSVALTLFAICATLLACLLSFSQIAKNAAGAPAPAPRSLPKPTLVPTEHILWEDMLGEFVMSLASTDWDTKFSVNGAYECVSSGDSKFVGSWRVNFGQLEVTKAMVDENGVPGAFSTWTVRWDRDKDNNLLGCKKDKKTGRNVKVEPTGTVVDSSGDDSVTFGLKRKKGLGR